MERLIDVVVDTAKARVADVMKDEEGKDFLSDWSRIDIIENQVRFRNDASKLGK